MDRLADRTSPGCVSISATRLLRVAPDIPARAWPETELERVDSDEVRDRGVSMIAGTDIVVRGIRK